MRPAEPSHGAEWLPLTAAQRGLYFAHQLAPASPAYSTAEVVEVSGGLEPVRLAAALQAAYGEFEQLRVRLRSTPHGPEQQVRPEPPTDLEVVELPTVAEVERWITEALAIPFDLDSGPLLRTALLRADDRSWWFHAAHHVLLDGFGYLQLARRVAEHYRGRPRPLVAVPLAQVVAEDRARQVDPGFWSERLETMAGPTSLAAGSAAPGTPALRVVTEVPEELAALLCSAAEIHQVAWTDLVTAALAGYLGRMLPGASTVRVGVPLMNRVLPGQRTAAARTVCTAMNVLPLTAATSGTLAELVGSVAAELVAIRDGAFVRQEDLDRELRRRGGGRLFGPMVNLLPFDPVLDFDGARGTIRNLTAGPVEDMTWCLRGTPGRGPVRWEVDANPELYDRAEVAAHADRMLHWLGVVAAAAPDGAVADLPLLGGAERARVLEEFNATDRTVPERTLPEAFAEQAARTPNAVALRCAEDSWTYAELAGRAATVAARLRAAGVGPGDVVAISAPRSLALFAGLYGIGAVGAAYLPIDPEQPLARIVDMLAAAGAVAVLDAELRLTPTTGRVEARAGEAAYVLFTSGSTGRPKGVVVGQRAIDNRLEWMQGAHPLQAGDVVLHKTPITFDVSVWELFWPLRVGASIEIAAPGGHRDPRYLARLIADRAVDTLHFVPSMLRAFVTDPAVPDLLTGHRVRQVFCSGEALTADLVEACREVLGSAPINLYGPTEAAVDVTAWSCDPERDGAVVPIGRPVWNTRCYVLDEQDRPVPIGVPGHLQLAGVQLAEGYAGRPDLTAAAFVADPFRPGERMYRTGDLAQWRPDGSLLYLGRADGQVKLRGQRLELGEVETVLGRVPGLRSLCVSLGATPGGEQRLVAWYAADEDREAELRAAATAYLPAFMVPSAYRRLPELPLTSSGKADRSALAGRRIEEAPVSAHAEAAPGSLLEEQAVAAMSRVLGEQCRPDDDFFARGGSSLSALRLIEELERVWSRAPGLADIFAAPTPRGLAARRGSAPGADLAPVLTLRAGDPERVPLVALPPAGGLGWCYASLLRHLPVDQPVHAVQSATLADPAAPMPSSLDDLAAWQLARLRSVVGDGPFHLLGWSIGGMAAHTVAALAEADGQWVGTLALLDAYPSEQWTHLGEPTETDTLRGLLRMAGAEHLAPESGLDEETTLSLLRGQGSALAGLPPTVLEASLRTIVNGTRLTRSGRHRRLVHDLLLLRAAAPRDEHWLDPTGWEPHLDGELRIVDLDCGHGDLLREPHVAAVAAALLDSWS